MDGSKTQCALLFSFFPDATNFSERSCYRSRPAPASMQSDFPNVIFEAVLKENGYPRMKRKDGTLRLRRVAADIQQTSYLLIQDSVKHREPARNGLRPKVAEKVVPPEVEADPAFNHW